MSWHRNQEQTFVFGSSILYAGSLEVSGYQRKVARRVAILIRVLQSGFLSTNSTASYYLLFFL